MISRHQERTARCDRRREEEARAEGQREAHSADQPTSTPDLLAGLDGQLALARQHTIGVAGTFNPLKAPRARHRRRCRSHRQSIRRNRQTKKMLDELQNQDDSEFD